MPPHMIAKRDSSSSILNDDSCNNSNNCNDNTNNSVGMYIDHDNYVNDWTGIFTSYGEHHDDIASYQQWPSRSNQNSTDLSIGSSVQQPHQAKNNKIRLLCQTRSPSFESLPSAVRGSTNGTNAIPFSAGNTKNDESRNESCHIRFRFMNKLGIRSGKEEPSNASLKTSLMVPSRRPYLQKFDVPLKYDFGKDDSDLIKVLKQDEDGTGKTPNPKEQEETEIYCCIPSGGMLPVARPTPNKEPTDWNDSEKNESIDDNLFDDSTTSCTEGSADCVDESMKSSSPTSVTNTSNTTTSSAARKNGTKPCIPGNACSTTVTCISSNVAKTNKQTKHSVLFYPKVHVWTIPNRKSYSKRISDTIWTSPMEMEQNAARNTYEYSAERWDYNSVALDEDMVVCQVTGEKIHPIHFIQ